MRSAIILCYYEILDYFKLFLMPFGRSLKTYAQIFYFNFLSILAYPYELLITVIQPAIEIGFLALFWNIVAKNSPNNIGFVSILTYFILVQFVQIWAIHPDGLNFSSYLSWRIKFGQISQAMMRPMRVLPTLLSEHRGMYFIDMIFSLVLLAIALKLIGSVTVLQLVWFVIFLFLAFIMTLSISILVSSIAFITKENAGIKNSITHLIRILSGVLVPLTLFPENIRSILVYSPFPSMVFAPINVLQHQLSSREILFNLVVAASWSVILFALAMIVWRHNIKKYEAVGI